MNQNAGLKIGHINARSMLSTDGDGKRVKLTVIKNLVEQYDIFAVSESWLNDLDMAKCEKAIHVDGYSVETNSRRCPVAGCSCVHLARGGGVVVYVKDNLKYSIKSIYNEEAIYKAFQYIHLKITERNGNKYPNGPLHVVAMYNPEGKIKPLRECLDVLPRQFQVVALGDVNVDGKNTTELHKYNISALGYNQLIKAPTHEESAIDHIYVTRKDLVLQSKVTIPNPKIADHNLISCTLKLSNETEYLELLISGIPKSNPANLNNQVIKLCKWLEMKNVKSHIVKVFRVNADVYVRFDSQSNRDTFYKQGRTVIRSKITTAGSVFGDGKTTPISIHEIMDDSLKDLYESVKELCKVGQYKLCVAYHGKVVVKKSEKSDAIVIGDWPQYYVFYDTIYPKN